MSFAEFILGFLVLVMDVCTITGELRGFYEGMCGIFVDDNLMVFL